MNGYKRKVFYYVQMRSVRRQELYVVVMQQLLLDSLRHVLFCIIHNEYIVLLHRFACEQLWLSLII